MSMMREMGPVEAENQELRKRVAELERERNKAVARGKWLHEIADNLRFVCENIAQHFVVSNPEVCDILRVAAEDAAAALLDERGKSTPPPAPNMHLVRSVHTCLDTLQDNIERGRDPDWFNAAWVRSLRNLLQVFINEVEVAAAVKGEPAMVRCEECGDSWPAGQGLGCDCRERILRRQADRA